MNTIRKHHLVTVFYCNGSATIKHLAFRLRPPPVPRTTNTLTHANQKNDSRIYRPHPQFCVFKTTLCRCHPKRIDRFQSTLKRSKTIDIARCDVSWTLCACYKHTRLRYFWSRSKTIDIARCDVSWTLCACYKHTRLRYFWSFWCVFDCPSVPHFCEMYAFAFLSTFKHISKSTRFRWNRSAY